MIPLRSVGQLKRLYEALLLNLEARGDLRPPLPSMRVSRELFVPQEEFNPVRGLAPDLYVDHIFELIPMEIEASDIPIYIQDKMTGEIREGIITLAERRNPHWNMRNRRVRLLHHAESDCVFCEDWDTPTWQSSLAVADEIDLEEFIWLKTLYANPDL